MPTNSRCQPADQAELTAFVAKAEDAGITSFWGPDWETEIITLCGEDIGEDSVICTDLRSKQNQFDDCPLGAMQC